MSDFLKIKTLSEVFHFLDLPAPRHPLISLIDYSKTPITRFIPPNKVTCDFYQIVLKGEESGSLKYGRETYDYQQGSLLYIAPNQVVEYGGGDEVSVSGGWTLMFHADLIRTFPLDKKMKAYQFFNYQSNEALHISEKERGIIESIVRKIEIELDSHIDEFSEEVLVTNLELLLNYSKRFYNRQFITRRRFDTGVVVRFEELLEAYFVKEKQKDHGIPSVQYFADELNYSANYLNELIKKSTDKSILEHVHYKVLELAKSYLLSSDKTVSEIAFDLGFEYSQYFSRLFKKKTGMTPMEYRKVS